MWVRKREISLPSEAHRKPQPLNWPLQLPSLLALLFLNAELPPAVCKPPPCNELTCFSKSNPCKKDQKGNIGVALQKERSLEQPEEGRVNPLTAPVPPP